MPLNTFIGAFIPKGRISPRHSGRLYKQIELTMRRELIKQLLEHTRYNQKRAADILGINRNTLAKWMRELEVLNDDGQN